MPEESYRPDLFSDHLLASLQRGELPGGTLRVPRHGSVYTSGDEDGMVYVVRRGRVKVAMLSPGGKECLLAIHTGGDLFGESCLGCGVHPETATAMEETTLSRIHHRAFLRFVSGRGPISDYFIQYMACRITEQQRIILDLMTVNSEYRLGQVLLRLGDKLGVTHLSGVRIEQRISHEELSQMVGTTRPRVSEFMHKFRELGLIEVSSERFLIIRKKALAEYLMRIS